MTKLRKIIFFLLPLTGFIAILFTTNSYQYFKLKNDFAAGVVKEVSEIELRELRSFFTNIENTLQLIRDWGKNDILLNNDVIGLNKKLFPLLKRQETIAAIIIANDNGQEYFLYKDGKQLLTRTSSAGKEGNTLHFQEWSSLDTPDKSWQEESTYDPRKRPWFLQSVSSNQVQWSKVYTFFHSKAQGVTASAAWETPDPSSKYCVVGIDIPLQGIRQILTLRNRERPGLLFLVNSSGTFFVTGEKSGNDTSVEVTEKTSNDLVSTLMEQWIADNQPDDQLIRIQRDGHQWLAALQKLQHTNGEFWLGVAAPEDELFSILNKELLKIDFVDLVIATTGGLIVLFVMWRLGAFQQTTPTPSAPIIRLHDYINQGEGSTVEFKSTVRTNLKTGKQGKEIELAWLKAVTAFLNMTGGTLLLGVDDAGKIFGIQRDDFASTDRCLLHIKNLINQHIGAEFSGLITTTPVECESDEVVMLECAHSKDPVFLKIGKNEEFYIRSGPSSVKLSPSQLVSFVLQKRSKKSSLPWQ